jgi:long-chain acyl-CoA synthetase
MKWKIFSRKKRKQAWRLIENPRGDVADVLAMPGAVVEGRIASRYLLSSGETQGTVIIQSVARKGILAGVDVHVDEDAAEKHDVDVAYQPRSGRASLRPADTISLEELMLQSKDEWDPVATEPGDLVCILYTSGTTGRPKGVPLTIDNIVSEQEATDQCLDMTPEDRVIGVLPFFHVFGLFNVLHLALVHGGSVILVPQYSPAALFHAIERFEPTLVIAIPTMFIHLQKLMQVKKKMLPASIRYCVSGAAPLPAETMTSFEKDFGKPVLEGYGLTETVAACCINPPKGIPKIGSIGLPLSGYAMKIMDKDGNELPRMEVGEIAIQGRGVMGGYYHLPPDSKQPFLDGWFLSGDMGYQDEDGYFFITDRKKEIIIKGGFNISPREIEETLQGHPLVKQAAVIGRKKREREEIVAFVTVRQQVDGKTLLAHCKGLLSRHKVPDDIRIVDVLPMSVTGKVLKKELAEDYQDERRIERP